MNLLKPKAYQVKKGDNLDQIAKRNGYKDWSIIYKSEFNRDLRMKRRNPDLIQPSDIVYIPPKNTEIVVELQNQIKFLTKSKMEYSQYMDAILTDSKEDLDKVNRIGAAVDTAVTVLSLVKSITLIARKGYQISKMAGETIKKSNELALDVLKMSYEPIIEAALDQYSDSEKYDKNLVTVFSQITVKSGLKMTSLAFWINTFVGLANGKSWQDAVTESPDDVFNKIKETVHQQKNQAMHDYEKKIEERKYLINMLSKQIDSPLPIKLK